MHPYSVLKMLANELRAEQGLPLVEELRETEPGRWGWVKVEKTYWDRVAEEST
jgi:hypothetical protein